MQRHLAWIAVFQNAPKIVKQIEDDDTKHDFRKDVLPRIEELKIFYLVGGGEKYGVNLETGDFMINDAHLENLKLKFATHVEVEYPITPPLRPIFFRRTTRVMDLNTHKMKTQYVYCLGWQKTVKIPVCQDGKRWHEEKRNTKHILYIFPDGSLTFG